MFSLEPKFVMFTDDTRVIMNHNDWNLHGYRANEVLKNTQTWLSCNRSTLNEDKTQYVIFHSKQRGHPFSAKELVLGNKIVSHVPNVKFLGLIIDENSTWDLQINHAVNSFFSKFLLILYKVICRLNTKLLNLICNLSIYPNIM